MELRNSDVSITVEQYIDKHHLNVYFEDAVSQLLEYKEENPKVNVTKFFHEYFTSVVRGNHTLFRDFSFIKSTPHNCSSFIRSFWKCYRQVGKNGGLLNVKEYYSLVCLLCPDFPFDILQKTAKIILMDDAMDCLMSFSDFLYAFQVQFYFETFLDKCSEIYTFLVEVNKQQQSLEGKNMNGVTEGISSGAFMDALSKEIYKKQLHTIYSCPPESALHEILDSATRVSFYGFLMALTKNSAINAGIGMLPDKTCLMDFNEKEVATRPSTRPLSAKPPRPPSSKKSK